MGLINCVDCGKEVSESAEACPNCGNPIKQAISQQQTPPQPEQKYTPAPPKKKKRGCLTVVLIVVGIFILICIIAALGGNDKQEQSASKTQQSQPATNIKPILPGDEELLEGLKLQVAGNNAEAIIKYTEAAEKDNAEAMLFLALMYDGKNGVEKNNKLYTEWMKKAADKNNALALLDIASWYADGLHGVKKDKAKADEFLEKAINIGTPEVFVFMSIEATSNGGLFNGPNKTQAKEFFDEAKTRLKNTANNNKSLIFSAILTKDYLRELENTINNMPDYYITAAQLFKEYDANEVAASNKYKGKLIQVTGKISGIDRDLLDRNSIVKLSVPGGYGFNDVWCNINRKHDEQVATLKKGQQITIIGKGGTFVLGQPQLEGCQVIK